MAKTVILGPDAKVDIGDPTFGVVPCRVLSGKITDAVKEATETTDTDTENAGQEFFSDTFSRALIELEIQLDNDQEGNIDDAPTVQMFATPLLLTPGGTIPITVWPEGRPSDGADENSQWIFYRILMTQGTHGFIVRGSTPQGAAIIGTSSGYYKRPYEAHTLGGDYLPPFAESLTAIGLRTPGRPLGAPPVGP